MTAVGMVLGALLSVGLPGHAPAQELASLSPSAPIQSAPAIPMFGTHEIHCFNLAPRVVSAAANSDYRAYYSINEVRVVVASAQPADAASPQPAGCQPVIRR